MAAAARRAMQKVLEAKGKAGGGGGGGGGSGLPGMIGTAAKLLVGAGAVGAAGYYSLFTIPGGHRGIIFNRLTGIRETVIGEGTHVLWPFLEWPIVYDIRTRPRNIQSLTGTRDLQMVNINVRVLSRPESKKLPFIYRRLGMDFDDRVLPSIVNEVCKQVIAQFNAAQLLTQREQVSRLIRRNLTDRAVDFSVVLEDVSITDLRFGREFTAAVERKQVAQQEAERAKFLVDKALQDKRSIIIKAQGEARSAEMVGKAIQDNPGFVELRRIDAARDIASTMSRSANKIYLDADTLLLNVMGAAGAGARMAEADNKDGKKGKR